MEIHRDRQEGRAPTALGDAVMSPIEPNVPRSHAPGEGRAHILLIDDEERLATTLRLALTPQHDVEVVTKGREALSRLRTNAYDVVLCDLLLPDISGPDIYEEISRTRPELTQRFVFLTGGAFTQKARSFLESVPNPRLEKPFDLAALEAVIQERLARV